MSFFKHVRKHARKHARTDTRASERVGLWFKAMRNRGDSDEVIMSRWQGTALHSHRYWHAETDGVGALYRFLAEQGARDIRLRGLGSSQKIPYHRRARHFLRAFRRTTAANVTWPLRAQPREEGLFFPLHFSVEETRRLKDLARRAGVNLRVYLLSVLDPIFRNWLRPVPPQAAWLIPVTLRTPAQLADYANRASYLLLPVRAQAPAREIGADFDREIKSGAYWGTYWLLDLISRLGPGAVQRVSDRNARRGSFMGTFSDLGDWTFQHPDPEVRDQRWASAPPASTPYPIGVSKLILNGKLSLGIRINRRIATPEPEAITRELENLADQLRAQAAGL